MRRNLLTLLLGAICVSFSFSTIFPLIGLIIFGCTAPTWPPRADQARSHFATHYAEIDRLAVLSQEHELWSVRQSTIDDLPVVGFPNPYERENRLSPELAGEFEELFESSKILGVTRADSITFLSIGHEVIDSVDWNYTYILPEPGAELPSGCDSVDRFAPCGRCLLTLEHGWLFRYLWRPADYQEADRLCR